LTSTAVAVPFAVVVTVIAVFVALAGMHGVNVELATVLPATVELP
jgi:hypothetical protein